ncbi:hypothetical protein EOD39_3258 [Acipenser ruthenus]|uniref:Uncharacterized protein n=1 Tax=Acipenser ruthenus TaxID=7906 RepID=A0A444UP48_ACIRT|nr:hypothetical protein EOD39_3258 [Acipenser ruthenus]
MWPKSPKEVFSTTTPSAHKSLDLPAVPQEDSLLSRRSLQAPPLHLHSGAVTPPSPVAPYQLPLLFASPWVLFPPWLLLVRPHFGNLVSQQSRGHFPLASQAVPARVFLSSLGADCPCLLTLRGTRLPLQPHPSHHSQLPEITPSWPFNPFWDGVISIPAQILITISCSVRSIIPLLYTNVVLRGNESGSHRF